MVIGHMQHSPARRNAGMVMQALGQELRNAAKTMAQVRLERSAVLIIQLRQYRATQRMNNMRCTEQAAGPKACQPGGVDLGERVKQRRIGTAVGICGNCALINPPAAQDRYITAKYVVRL